MWERTEKYLQELSTESIVTTNPPQKEFIHERMENDYYSKTTTSSPRGREQNDICRSSPLNQSLQPSPDTADKGSDEGFQLRWNRDTLFHVAQLFSCTRADSPIFPCRSADARESSQDSHQERRTKRHASFPGQSYVYVCNDRDTLCTAGGRRV